MMGSKRIIVIVGVAISAILLTVFLIATAPAVNCFMGLILYDKWSILSYDSDVILVYNWILGLVAFAMTVSVIIMFRFRRLKLYARLLIPYIISLIIVMIYAGLNIYYIGDGFVRIKNPFLSGYDYKNRNGKTIFYHSSYVEKQLHNGKIVFLNNWGYTLPELYDEDGNRFLVRPTDDEYGIRFYDDFYYTGKSFSKDDGYFDYERIRFFDKDGNYIETHEYGLGGFRPDGKSGELLGVYLEEVVEKPGGVKVFSVSD